MTLEEDAGIQRTNPRHRRSTRQRRANGVVPSPTRFSVLGVLSTWQGEWGPLRGKWGVSPFFPLVQSFFLSPFLTQKHTHNPLFQIYLIHMYNYSVSLSLWFLPLSSPTPYLLWDLWRRQPCPTRDAKNGDTTSGQRTWATPRASHPLPLQTALLPHTQLILNQ